MEQLSGTNKIRENGYYTITGLSQGTYTVNGKSFTYNGKYQMIDAEK